MKRKLYNPMILVLLVFVPLIAFSGTEQKASESYYEQLKSLLTRKTLKVRPNASKRDVNLIETEKGAAGVLFGASMDDIVAIWGKPCGIDTNRSRNIWSLSVGACRFGFIENELVSVSIHSATLEKAPFETGINFKSSFDDVMSAFGKPIQATDYSLKFVTKNGYIIRFHFVADTSSIGKRKLITIKISHPDSGE
ncbi:MAG: hypothetical protein A2Z38_03555 [Planctomycetes bacterium RBG_19FT_COMBO_48_8]|nr:MAG: hypothetical protein A2Z38_03555 [Planctomycetes bacterium RBG_19FT_COMBO_48_8]